MGIPRGIPPWFAILEDGDALAELTADYAGTASAVYPTFVHQARYSESMLDGWKDIKINSYNTELPSCVYRIRYKFLTGGATRYTDMAAAYRAYLEDTGFFNGRADDAYPLYAETLGSVNVYEKVGIFPVNHEVALTTLEEDLAILRALKEGGAAQVQLKLTGALNGGLMNGYNDRARLCGVLGSRGDWDALFAFAEENGYGIYPNAEFARVYDNGLFDRFHPLADAAAGWTINTSAPPPAIRPPASTCRKAFRIRSARRCFPARRPGSSRTAASCGAAQFPPGRSGKAS